MNQHIFHQYIQSINIILNSVLFLTKFLTQNYCFCDWFFYILATITYENHDTDLNIKQAFHFHKLAVEVTSATMFLCHWEKWQIGSNTKSVTAKPVFLNFSEILGDSQSFYLNLLCFKLAYINLLCLKLRDPANTLSKVSGKRKKMSLGKMMIDKSAVQGMQ